MLAPKVLIISRVLETRHNPRPAPPGRVPARSRGTWSEGTPPSRSLPERPHASPGEKGVKSRARQKVQPSPFRPAPLPPPPTPRPPPPPQTQCHMNLYSHSEEEEPDPRLTQRPPSPHGIRPPLTAAPPRPPAPRRPSLPPAASEPGSGAGPGRAVPRRFVPAVPVPAGPERLAGPAGTALTPSRSCAVSLRQTGPGGRAASRAEPGRAGPGTQGALRWLKASSRLARPAAGAEVGFSWLKDLEGAFLQFLGGGRAARRSRSSAPSFPEL